MEITSIYGKDEFPRLVGVAAIYFLIAYLTNYYFSSISIDIPVIRPSVGFALGIVLIAGKRYWPAILVGSLSSRLAHGDTFVVSVLIAAGVAAGSVLGSWLLEKDKKFDIGLNSIQHFFRLMLWSGVLGAGISALTGTFSLLETNLPSASSFFEALMRWWMGDTLGIALITPLILTWRKPPRNWLLTKNLPFVTSYFILTFLAGQIIFMGWFHEVFGKVALGYWMFAFVVWGAARLGIYCAAVVLPMVMIQALTGAASGVGFFGADITNSRLLNVWFYLLCLTIVGMGLGATINAFRKSQDEIRNIASHDSLTGLANRYLLTDRIQQAITVAKRENHRIAIIFHDLDHFKSVNDDFGHHVGDALLKQVSSRVRCCVRESDTIARMGGDEFVILLPAIVDTKDVMTVAEKIRQELLLPFLI
jgi:GGDEF domain-containing protein